ncbi:hypothetical protein [Elizabethkingia sp. 2-6]|uniref:hypothetical protein n=1 Tax=Elizabethkingia sp. 2-6 TaxID=2575699 RepID=UPI0010C17307|nr:hypothetical protein [Elizabethkingia sp. 2-6]QCO45915.1 hypothetical protein FCS00_05825 [Elizabethkingia sp. 2-6]
MKNKILLILILILNTFPLFGQEWKVEDKYEKLFFIEDFSKSRNHRVSKYTLNTKELYGIEKNIEVNNIILKNYKGEDWGILLISALPDLQGKNDWVKVKYDLIKDKIMISPKIEDISFKDNGAEKKIKKTLKYGIIKKVGNDYFIPNHCLTEFFKLRDYKYPLIVDYGTINIKENPLSIKEMSQFYKENYPVNKELFPMDTSNLAFHLVGLDYTLIRNYLSKQYMLKNQIAYQFWTFDNWSVTDYYNVDRGIDRFVYIPEKGIVGGSYDFYFEFNGGKGTIIPYKNLWDNILNEKVMIAEELK